MNPPYGVIFFLVILFGFGAVSSIVQARRKKEKTYYLGAVVSCLMLFVFFLALLSQFLLAFVLLVATGVLSAAALPKAIKVQRREMAKQLAKELQEVDFSTPLRARDFLAWKGWLKLAHRWGIWKTVTIYSLFGMMVIAGISYTVLSIFGIMNIWYVVGYTVPTIIAIFILFYRQISKALKEIKLNA